MDIPDQIKAKIERYQTALAALDEPGTSAASKSDDIRWARHLWKEWKYRHDHKWRTLYRGLWAIVIVATVPWLKPEFFDPISRPFSRIMYGILPLLIFGSMCIGVAGEYAELKRVEEKLASARGTHGPDKRDSWAKAAFLSSLSTGLKSGAFILIFCIVYGFWFYKLYTRELPFQAQQTQTVPQKP